MHAVIMMPSVVEMILNKMRPTVTPIRVFASAQHKTASTTVIQKTYASSNVCSDEYEFSWI